MMLMRALNLESNKHNQIPYPVVCLDEKYFSNLLEKKS